jgi:hypothetical protein
MTLPTWTRHTPRNSTRRSWAYCLYFHIYGRIDQAPRTSIRRVLVTLKGGVTSAQVLAKEPTEILSAPPFSFNFFFLGKPSTFPGQSPFAENDGLFLSVIPLLHFSDSLRSSYFFRTHHAHLQR